MTACTHTRAVDCPTCAGNGFVGPDGGIVDTTVPPGYVYTRESGDVTCPRCDYHGSLCAECGMPMDV